jgi:uncharacterized membrane-anchored protein
VLATFALGTALGDFTATDAGLQFFPSFVMFGAIILIPLVLRYRLGVNSIFCFWFAYTITRPFGASWADWNEQPIHSAGLNVGQIPTAIYLGLIAAGLVSYMFTQQVGLSTSHADLVNPAIASDATH